jgi:hypothetical protein
MWLWKDPDQAQPTSSLPGTPSIESTQKRPKRLLRRSMLAGLNSDTSVRNWVEDSQKPAAHPTLRTKEKTSSHRGEKLPSQRQPLIRQHRCHHLMVHEALKICNRIIGIITLFSGSDL